MAAYHLPREEDQRQWRIISVVIYVFVTQALFLETGLTLNCSEPTTNSLLAAFEENIYKMVAVRPVKNLKTPTNVSIYVTLYAILGVDEKAQILTTLIWLDLTWEIEFLSWDAVECGTSSITLPRKRFWVPDIVIDEFVEENNAPETYYVEVSNTGVIKDALPVEVSSSCDLDIFKFPFDIQNCSYTFNSWMHNDEEIQLFFGGQVEEMLNTSMDVLTTKGEWDFIDMRAEKLEFAFEGTPLDQIKFYITLKRQPTLYVVNLLIPSFFLVTVDLLSFLLPPQSVDRSAFKMTLILGYTVFLLLMNDLLPITGNSIPLINVFFSLCLALMVGSLLETIIITNMVSGSMRELPLPNWIRVVFLKYLARLVCMGKITSKRTQNQGGGGNPFVLYQGEYPQVAGRAKEPQTTDPSLLELKGLRDVLRAIQTQLDTTEKTDQTKEDWITIGLVIDRLLFGVYFIFLLFSLIAILIIWTTWYTEYHGEDH